jgi:uncharacterized membrane protein
MSETKKITQDDKIWGLLSYIWIFSLVALVAKKDNDFVRFHANQGALLFILSLVGIIPGLGQLLVLVLCILAIIGMIMAYKGEKWELPLIGGVAKDFGDWIIKTMKI